AGAPEVHKLDKAGQVEMRLVAAGARRDMDQLDAAIVTLQSPELASSSVQPWTARLRYAYADALLAAGREGEAREWFAKAIESDKDGSTDASDRLAELDGVEFVDALVEDGAETVTETEVAAETGTDTEVEDQADLDEDVDAEADREGDLDEDVDAEADADREDDLEDDVEDETPTAEQPPVADDDHDVVDVVDVADGDDEGGPEEASRR
ncbi:MAG: hypothetical protein QOC85_1078, partial [Streptomyces sp.]|nr:hypothetical protein [Streptomyces sp.]